MEIRQTFKGTWTCNICEKQEEVMGSHLPADWKEVKIVCGMWSRHGVFCRECMNSIRRPPSWWERVREYLIGKDQIAGG